MNDLEYIKNKISEVCAERSGHIYLHDVLRTIQKGWLKQQNIDDPTNPDDIFLNDSIPQYFVSSSGHFGMYGVSFSGQVSNLTGEDGRPGTAYIRRTTCYWDLEKPRLEDQSEETLDGLVRIFIKVFPP